MEGVEIQEIEMQDELVKYNVLAANRGSERCMAPLIPHKGRVFVSSDLCLHPDCEYLTERGWVPVANLQVGEKVWQVDKDTLQGSFVEPLRIIERPYKGDIIHYQSVRGDLKVTKGHTMLHVGQMTHKRADKRLWRGVFLAGNKPASKAGNWCTFSYSTQGEDNFVFVDEDIWRVCALQADSYYNKSEDIYIIQVIKERKENKLNTFFKKGRVTTRKDNGKRVVCYRERFKHPLISEKDINIERLNPSQIPVFLEALEFFDGCPSSRTSYDRIFWTTTNIPLANRIQAYLVKHGYECRITVTTRDNENWSDFASLSIKKEGTIRSWCEKRREHTSELREKYKGTVYCVTVPSGFILIRHEGQTWVVGNCSGEPNFILNYSDDAFLYSILKGKGKAFIDSNGYFNSRSLYISTLSKTLLYKDIIDSNFVDKWNNDEEKVKIEIKKAYKLSKVAVLSVLYGAGIGNPHKNTGLYNLFKLNNAGISFEETKKIWYGFWDSIPDVAKFRDTAQAYFEQCKKDKKPAVNAFGFIIPSGDPHKAMNYIIQSSLSAWIRELLKRLYQNKIIGVNSDSLAWLVCVVHDELVVEVGKENVEEYREGLMKTVEDTNKYFGLKYPLELGFNVGSNFYEIH